MAGSRFTRVTSELLDRSLSGRLQPTVDRVRDIAVRFGQRPYIVRLVKTRWTGGLRERGEETLVQAVELLPTPRLANPTSLTTVVSIIGLEELGQVRVDRISGKYTEDFFRGRGSDGVPMAEDSDLYYEIEFPAVRGAPAQRRRFNLASVPAWDPGGFQWVLTLERTQSVDPARDDTSLVGEVL